MSPNNLQDIGSKNHKEDHKECTRRANEIYLVKSLLVIPISTENWSNTTIQAVTYFTQIFQLKIVNR